AAAVLRQVLVAEADATFVTRLLIQAGIQGKAGAIAQHDAAIAETGDADLRALQVGEDGHTAPLCCRRLTNTCRHLAMALGVAVGKIQPEHVDASSDQRRQHLCAVTGRANGGDNLGASEHAGFSRWTWRQCSTAHCKFSCRSAGSDANSRPDGRSYTIPVERWRHLKPPRPPPYVPVVARKRRANRIHATKNKGSHHVRDRAD